MTKYYFLGTILPDIAFGQQPSLSIMELDELLKDNLKASDYQKTIVVRRFFDLENLRALWGGTSDLDPRGELQRQELEEALNCEHIFPGYVRDYLSEYETTETRLKNFSSLLAAYYREELSNARGGLKAWLQFEKELWLIQAVYRGRKLGRELTVEMPASLCEDPFVEQLLASKEDGTFLADQEELRAIFDYHYDTPLQLHQKLSRYRFEKAKCLLCAKAFSFDRILGTMIQLFILQNVTK